MKLEQADLENMELRDLQELRNRVERAIAIVQDRKREEALKEIQRIARESGLSVAEIVEGQRKQRGAAPARYVHPDDPEITWSGLGRQPKWYKDLIKAGRKPEELEIKKARS